MSDYGRRLVRLREARGLSRRAAADGAGLNQETLRNAEESVRQPRFDTRFALARFYGVDPQTLEPVPSGRQDRPEVGLPTDSSVGTVAASTEDSTDMREENLRRAQQLLGGGLPAHLQDQAVAHILRLNIEASQHDQRLLLGKGQAPKEGSG